LVSAGEITGVARVIAGDQSFEGIRYRIAVVEKGNRRNLVEGTIEADPAVMSALHDAGDAAIELAGSLGWFEFVVTDVHLGRIKIVGPVIGV
jgi:hypothetical protein